MAVCHFPSEAAALTHLKGKGFKQVRKNLWINAAVSIHAQLENSARGWCIFLYEA